MQKRTWLAIFAVLALAAVFGGGYYRYLSETRTVSSGQQEGEKEFSDFLSQKRNLSQKEEEVSLAAVGDISYSRGVEGVVLKQGGAYYPLLKMGDYLQGSDLVFGNLESPITPGPRIPNFEMMFRSNPGTERALLNAGFSVLSLANNHTPNFGEKGLEDTFRYLDDAGIRHVGAGKNTEEANRPVFIEKKGIRFAFLAYNDSDVVPTSYEATEDHAGTAFMRIDKMTSAVREAKQKADFVIVSIHSGAEYTDTPNESQINFAHAAIDAGADLVIGHHPHVVQSMEQYKGKYIFYSLGNFIFDQMWSEDTKQGLVIKVFFTKKEIKKISLLPVVMENMAQPSMATDDKAKSILERLSFPLRRSDVYYWDGVFEKASMGAIYEIKSEVGTVVSKTESADLDSNAVRETYSLENGRLSVTENSKILWQSPDNWWIDDFILADSNNDGTVDINLSLWKSGDFGTSKPFQIKENDGSVKNHFFVYDLVYGKIKPIWGSSNLSAPNCEFRVADIDGDGKNKLVTIEGDYSQTPLCNGGYVAVWKWNGWGFSNEWRSEKGDFSGLEIEKIDAKSYIIVDTL